MGVLKKVPAEVCRIYVVDDFCPESTGAEVTKLNIDPRVTVIQLSANQGVGGAVLAGYQQAFADGADVAVKVDGDGQMDPAWIPRFVRPIALRLADYTKGNRFYKRSFLAQMPWVRLLGNSGLSFLAKLSTGYWHMMDPTNGYTAIHRNVFELLEIDRLEKRFFFETDLLFQLYLLRAVVLDVPLPATYGEEKSNLKILDSLFVFSRKHLNRIFRRIFYTYFLRDFNLGTIYGLSGAGFGILGVVFGSLHWWKSIESGVPATSGTVMLAAICVILSAQLLIAALSYDITNVPKTPLWVYLSQDDSFK